MAKLYGETVAQLAPNNNSGNLKVSAIVLPLKYLNNFWKSLVMPLVNSKDVFKLKNCNLVAAGVDSVNANDYNIMFTMKDTNLYVPVVTLSAKCNQKLLKRLSKGSERSVYWNKCKTREKIEK